MPSHHRRCSFTNRRCHVGENGYRLFVVTRVPISRGDEECRRPHNERLRYGVAFGGEIGEETATRYLLARTECRIVQCHIAQMYRSVTTRAVEMSNLQVSYRSLETEMPVVKCGGRRMPNMLEGTAALQAVAEYR